MNEPILSEKLFTRSKKVTPGGVHSPVRAFKGVGGVPRFISRAQGAFLTDVDGNSYLDFCMAWGPLIFGHQDPEILEEVNQALHSGWSFGTAEPYSLELAELITSRISWVEKIRFVNSGTEAVMSALRVARAATQKTKIIKFDGCYHGHVDSMLVRAGSGLAEMATPDSAGVSATASSETIVVPLDNLAAFETALNLYEKDIAAVIIEPVPANNGLLLPKPDFLKTLRLLTAQKNILLIFDEVITGFRVAFGGEAERSQIEPDLVCYGKIIGGGFPVGAYGGKKELMDLVAPQGPVYQAGTLSANPVAMRAGLTNLKKILRENPYARLESKTHSIAKEMESIVLRSGLDIPFKVQHTASLFWSVFGEVQTSDQVVRAPNQFSFIQKDFYSKVFHHLLKQGIYLAPSGYEVSFLSTAHTEAQLGVFLDAFKKTCLELEASFLGQTRGGTA